MKAKENRQLSLIDSFGAGIPTNKYLERIEKLIDFKGSFSNRIEIW